MGFFKDMNDLKKLGDHHGGMPSMKSAFKDIRAVADDRGEGEVIEKGLPTRAVAKSFAEPVPGDRFAMHILLDVYPPDGGSPYPIDYVFPTTRMKAAITVGMEIPVKVHPDDPQRIAVQWDAQQANIAAAGGDMAAVMQGMGNTYGAAADEAFRVAQGKQAAEDPVEKLEKLKQMKDAGLITSDEFDAKKADVLKEM